MTETSFIKTGFPRRKLLLRFFPPSAAVVLFYLDGFREQSVIINGKAERLNLKGFGSSWAKKRTHTKQKKKRLVSSYLIWNWRRLGGGTMPGVGRTPMPRPVRNGAPSAARRWPWPVPGDRLEVDSVCIGCVRSHDTTNIANLVICRTKKGLTSAGVPFSLFFN